jgi:hypothetical protein
MVSVNQFEEDKIAYRENLRSSVDSFCHQCTIHVFGFSDLQTISKHDSSDYCLPVSVQD